MKTIVQNQISHMTAFPSFESRAGKRELEELSLLLHFLFITVYCWVCFTL